MKRAMTRQMGQVVGIGLLVLGGVLAGVVMDSPRVSAGGEAVSVWRSAEVVVRAAGRGRPWLNLQDGRVVSAVYAGPAALVAALKAGEARGVALAAGDIDGDGVADLIAGYALGGRGMITLHRGNRRCRYPRPEETFLQIRVGTFAEPPFVGPVRVYEVPEAVGYLGVGDVDGDGRADVVTAARGGSVLYLLAGRADGLGGAQSVKLPGRITALVVGQMNRRDGRADIGVGLDGAEGPQVVILGWASGVLSGGRLGVLGTDRLVGNGGDAPVGSVGQPTVFALPGEARALALGRLDGDELVDMAVVAGEELVIIPGWETASGIEAQSLDPGWSRVERVDVPVRVRTVAVGDFVWDREQRAELAVVGEAGQVLVLEAKGVDRRPWSEAELRVREEELVRRWAAVRERLRDERWHGVADEATGREAVAWEVVVRHSLPASARSDGVVRQPAMVARLSSRSGDDLVILDSSGHQVHILMLGAESGVGDQRSEVWVSLDVVRAPVAVVSMSLNYDGQEDVVVMGEGEVEPAVALSLPLSTFTVTKTADTADGVCDADCSLREAIIAANSSMGADMIMVPAGTYTLALHGMGEDAAASGDLDVTDGVTIMGAGQASTIIQAGTSSSLDRVFDIPPSAGRISVTFNGMTIKRGGGSSSFKGGGIRNSSGTMTVSWSTVSNNSASSGGGIFNDSGTVAVNQSTVSNNSVGFDGGGIWNSSGAVNVTNSTLSDNNTSGNGGGIFNDSGTVTVNQSTLSNNTTIEGGGVWNFSGAVNVTNSTLSGNGADRGGGIWNSSGAVNVTNSTLSGNRAGLGGGIRNGSGLVNVNSSTLSGNRAGLGGGIRNGSGLVNVNNSIITSSQGGNCSGLIISLGYNISTDGSCNLSNTGDMNNTDPLLEPLGDNGGPTQTHALKPNSPAIDAGNPACEVTDQRGVIRPIDGDGDGTALCDIGAFEAAACTSADSVPPAISCPGDMVVECTSPDGAVVTFTATAADNCDPTPTVVCDPASGSIFSLGTTTVTCTATDAAGNVATCTFDVTVHDTTPPAITSCPGDRTVSADASCQGTIPDVAGEVVASDNCTAAGSLVVTQDPAAGTLVGLGDHVVTVTVSDVAGNSSTCTLTVTVQDTTPPSISCPADVVVECTGPDGAVVTFATPTATDNCDPTPTVVCDPASGSTFALGTTTVSCTATDASGNTASCTFTVTVVDTTPPQISCPADVTLVADAGCQAVFNTSATASDTCDPGPVVSSDPPLPAVLAGPVGAGAVTHTITFTATDASGNTASCTVTVTVVNSAPVADAGVDQEVDEGAMVTLDGTGSHDPDAGQPLTFQWVQVGGPAVTLSDPTSATPSFMAPAVSDGECVVLMFRLRVTDPCGARAEDVVVVSVNDVLVLQDERSSNCLRLFPCSGRFAWRLSNGQVIRGTVMIERSGSVLNFKGRGRGGEVVQGGISLVRRTGTARLTTARGRRLGEIRDSNIDDNEPCP